MNFSTEEPPQHSDDRFQLTTPLQGHHRVGPAQFHFVIFETLTHYAGYDAGCVDDHGVGYLSGLLYEGSGGNYLLQDKALRAYGSDEMECVGVINAVEVCRAFDDTESHTRRRSGRTVADVGVHIAHGPSVGENRLDDPACHSRLPGIDRADQHDRRRLAQLSSDLLVNRGRHSGIISRAEVVPPMLDERGATDQFSL